MLLAATYSAAISSKMDDGGGGGGFWGFGGLELEGDYFRAQRWADLTNDLLRLKSTVARRLRHAQRAIGTCAGALAATLRCRQKTHL